MKRRDFIKQTFAGSMLLGISPALLQACASADPLHEFGIISGVLSNELKENPKATLEQIAKMGYRHLEFGGSFGMQAKECLSFLKDIGLNPLAGGTSLVEMQGDKLQKIIDESLELEKQYLICYWPWMKGTDNIGMDDLKFAVDELNRIGELCNESGIRLAFHNHDHEFTAVGNVMPYDYFMANMDPELVTMEFDVYWATVGGADPVEVIRKYPGRFEILHIKDAYDVSDRESFACVGEGVIDFERILRERKTGGFKHLVVEKDGAKQGIKCAQQSINHLNTLEF